MPKFMLILRGDVTADYSHLTPEDFAQILDEYSAWGNRMAADNRLLGGDKLQDQGGMVIHARDGEGGDVSDGPYVESKEVVGGYYLVEADDLQHAAKLCEGHPNFRFGSIEIRPVDEVVGPQG